MLVDLLDVLCSYSMVSISLSLQSKLEDIRLEQEKEAEMSIRLHFKMEQIIYCQDQIYRGALQKVREEEAEEEKKTKHGTSSSSQSQDLQTSSMAEIFQHLNAYRQVSV
jgi:interferon-induced GTP-binding protein Mx1